MKGNDTYYLEEGINLHVFWISISGVIESKTTERTLTFMTNAWIGLENKVLILNGVYFIESTVNSISSEIALRDAKSKLEILIKDNRELLLEYFKNDSIR